MPIWKKYTLQKPVWNNSDQKLYIGEILLSNGHIKEFELQLALKKQIKSRISLGEILIQQQAIDPWSLENALLEQLHYKCSSSKHLLLGQILKTTRKISPFKLNKALEIQKQTKSVLGEVLLQKFCLEPRALYQALRLQKRYLRNMVLMTAGLSFFMSCKTPTVPIQMPQFSDMQIAATRPFTAQALAGDFKTLSLVSGSNIRIYRNGSKIIENVPFFKQGRDNTCGQAVVAMLANYWGNSLDYQQLVNKENPFNLATSAPALRQSLREKGLQAQDFRQGTIDNLIAEVNKGYPTAVLLDFGSIQTAHYVIVVGYNFERKSLILHDSIEAPYFEMPLSSFEKMWENDSIRSILPVGAKNYQRLMFKVSKQTP